MRQLLSRTGEWLLGRNGRWLLLWTAVFLLTRIFAELPAFTESVYSRGLYPVLAAVLGFLSDLVPFSLHEILVILLLLYAGYHAARGIHRRSWRENGWRPLLSGMIRGILITLVLIYSLFYLLWGFNYFRIKLEESFRFAPVPDRKQALIRLLDRTISEANRLHTAVLPTWPVVNKEINTLLGKAMLDITGTDPHTAGRIKGSITGWLSAFGIGGITLPFFQEAHLAGDLLSFERPFIAAHEKTHLKGRTQEAEANFFAWLVCTRSTIPAIRYSGHFCLIRYLLGALPKVERKAWIKKISPGVRLHFKAQRERNLRRNSTLSRISRAMNNVYLKANKVRGGIRNYSMVVRLALAWEKSRKP